jgi:uncharacterized protein (DUF2147 family)
LRLILTLAVLALPFPAAAAPSIFGNWVTDDHSAVVRIDRCGNALCGTVARVLNAKAPSTDVHNPDPAHRKRPLVGVAVLSGFHGAGADWSGGQAYDPKAGRSYRSRLKLEGNDRLQVTGCVFFLCRTLTWTRAS